MTAEECPTPSQGDASEAGAEPLVGPDGNEAAPGLVALPHVQLAGLLGNDAEALEELSLTTSCRPAQIAAPSEPGSSDAVGDLELDDPLALLTEVVHTADSPGASFEPSGWVDLKKARVPTPPVSPTERRLGHRLPGHRALHDRSVQAARAGLRR